MKTIIIIPTYNERENLPELLRRIEALGLELHAVVVDDDSPDGTGKLAEEMSATRPWLRVLHRPGKQGLGTAYLAGFRHCLNADYEVIGHMDADLSHDPSYLPAMLRALEDADLVLGSRYRPGGGVRNWSWIRQALSRWGSFYSRALLGIGVSDLTGGFKLFRRQLLEDLGLDTLHASGYAFNVETTYRALRRGYRVAEVPIIFEDRRQGSSKLSRGVIAEAALVVPRLRWENRSRPVTSARQEETLTTKAQRHEEA